MSERPNRDLLLLRAMKNGLPLTKKPYGRIAASLGLSEMDVIQALLRLQREGLVRQVSASVDHRRLGILYNAMVAWRIPEARVQEAAEAAARFDAVSHVSETEPGPNWPYTLYTVVRARTQAGCEAVIERLAKVMDAEARVALYGERELKRDSLSF